MASNFFGQIFRITTFGESHGPAMGVVIDGCPAGLAITLEEIQRELSYRRPGKNSFVSPRKESDHAEILSGIFEGKTTGAPIAILIRNEDADSTKYEPIKDILRPGHANFTYLEKYGIFDYRGGGRSSGRETAARVAAGAIAKKFLQVHGIGICSFIAEIGGIAAPEPAFATLADLQQKTRSSPIFCPDAATEGQIIEAIKNIEGDSFGGIIQTIVENVPIGLGEPIYGKLEAQLASAMMSIPATKGFEMGAGFAAARMKGSEHNDAFDIQGLKTNYAGGTLGGISTGQPLVFRVAVKPTSSIHKVQATVTTKGERVNLTLPEGSRHDPCIAIRAVPVVEAMTALVLADAILCNRSARAFLGSP